MKRILITGANSFLGDNTKKYIEQYSDYKVDVLDMIDSNWNRSKFDYDVVINVCAIVHCFEKTSEELYYKVNRDLAVEIAKKAKEENVKQFIQISTNGVFGIELGEMNSTFGFNPKTPYERSKYEADLQIDILRDDRFKVCIIRPPMIYGKGCKGNFPKLEKYALSIPFFPSLKNKRDFIFITNLCDFIKFAIDNQLNEICYPRNKETIAVSTFVKEIASANNRKMSLLFIFNPFIRIIYRFSHRLKSIFGDCYCTEKICSLADWYPPISFSKSMSMMYEE